MTQFGSDVTETPDIPAFETPKGGVEDLSGSTLLSGASNVMKLAGDIFEDKKESDAAKSVAGFTKKQLLVAESVAQGQRSQAAAKILLRKHLIEAIDANPLLAAEYIKAQNSILGISGGAKIIDEGREEDQHRKLVNRTLVENGWVKPGASDKEFDEAANTWMKSQEADRRYQETKKTIELQLKANDLSSSERTRHENQMKDNAYEYVRGSIDGHYQNMLGIANEILSSDATEAEKEQNLNNAFASFNVDLTTEFSYLDESDRALFKGPFEDLQENAIKLARGEINDAEMERANKRILAGWKNVFLQDDTLAKIAISQEMFDIGSYGHALSAPLANKIFGVITGNSEEGATNGLTTPSPYKPGNGKAFEEVLGMVYNGLASNDPKVQENALHHFDEILGNLSLYEKEIRNNPEKATDIVRLIASRRFYKALSENIGELTNLDEAREVLQTNFFDEALELFSREFEKGEVISLTDMNGLSVVTPAEAGKYIGVRSTNIGVEFYALPDTEGAAPVDLKSKVKQLNGDLRQAMNLSIHAFSHISGTNDYKSMADDMITRITGGAGDSKVGGGDAGDELDLNAFKREVLSAEPLPMTEINTSLVGTIDGQGFTHGRTMSSVDGMIIHHTAGRGSVEGVVTTLQNRGLSVQFVIDRDGSVHQLMADNQVAWHAGRNNKSGFDNRNTIGVEIIGNDDTDILPAQVEAAKRLVKTMSEKYGFDPSKNVFGHGEVSTHKQATEGASVISALRGNRKG